MNKVKLAKRDTKGMKPEFKQQIMKKRLLYRLCSRSSKELKVKAVAGETSLTILLKWVKTIVKLGIYKKKPCNLDLKVLE